MVTAMMTSIIVADVFSIMMTMIYGDSGNDDSHDQCSFMTSMMMLVAQVVAMIGTDIDDDTDDDGNGGSDDPNTKRCSVSFISRHFLISIEKHCSAIFLYVTENRFDFIDTQVCYIKHKIVHCKQMCSMNMDFPSKNRAFIEQLVFL